MNNVWNCLRAILVAMAAATGFIGKATCIDSLPPFERAVVIIKYYETMHHPKDWPYIGYGHQVQPGEPYWRGIQLNERQADALLRHDLIKFIRYYSRYGRHAVLLGTLAYNCGFVAVDEGGVLKKLRVGDPDILREYTSYCHYNGKFHQRLFERRVTELAMLYEDKREQKIKREHERKEKEKRKRMPPQP